MYINGQAMRGRRIIEFAAVTGQGLKRSLSLIGEARTCDARKGTRQRKIDGEVEKPEHSGKTVVFYLDPSREEQLAGDDRPTGKIDRFAIVASFAILFGTAHAAIFPSPRWSRAPPPLTGQPIIVPADPMRNEHRDLRARRAVASAQASLSHYVYVLEGAQRHQCRHRREFDMKQGSFFAEMIDLALQREQNKRRRQTAGDRPGAASTSNVDAAHLPQGTYRDFTFR